MAEQAGTQRLASSITVEDLTEAAVRGVQRALAARGPDGTGKPGGPITVGVILEPPPTDGRPPELPPGDRPDLFPLKTGAPISREATGKLADKLSRSRELAYTLAQSLQSDFVGTLQQLFELTPDQYATLKAVARDRRASLDHLGRVLAAVVRTDDDLQVTLDIAEKTTAVAKKEKEEADKKGIDWEIKIETKCETDKNCSAGVSLTIKF